MASDYLEAVAQPEGDLLAALKQAGWKLSASLEHARLGRTGRDSENYTIDRRCELLGNQEGISGEELAAVLGPKIIEQGIILTYRRKRGSRIIFNVYERG